MDFIDCLKAYFKGETLKTEDENIKRIALEQGLASLLYPVLGIDYKKYYVSNAIINSKMIDIENELTAVLNEKGIKHFFFKGAVFSKLYPDSAYRTRGDIDIYLEPSKVNKAIEALIEKGYKWEKEKDCHHHTSIFKDNIEVELHFNLIDPGEDKKIMDLFNNPFEILVLEAEYKYKFIHEYHILYAIWHFAHHLRYGAGIRYIFDFYYLLKKNVDFNKLQNIIKEYGFDKLYNNILNVIFVLSGETLDKFDKCDTDYFIDYMLSHGVHGHSSNNDSMSATIHKNKFNYFFGRVFLTNKNYRINRYPILGAHWFLYPLCLIKHIFYLIFRKFSKFILFLFGRNSKKKLYKKLGI